MIREELETVNQKMQEKADKKEHVETTLQDTKESFNMVSDELNSFAGKPILITVHACLMETKLLNKQNWYDHDPEELWSEGGLSKGYMTFTSAQYSMAELERLSPDLTTKACSPL